MGRKVVRVHLPPEEARIIEAQVKATGLSEGEILRASWTRDLYQLGILQIRPQTAP